MSRYKGMTRVLGMSGLGTILLATSLMLSGCGDVSRTAEEHIQNAQEHRLAGDLNAAVIELKSALQRNPDSAAARFMLGEIYLEIGDGASAEKELVRARELGMAEEATLLPVARSWLLQGENNRILAELPVPSPDNPQYVTVMTLHGQALLGLGQLDAAEAAYSKATDIAPNSLEAVIGLARVAMGRSDLDKAAELQTRVEGIGPNAIESRSLKADLAFLRENYDEAAEIYASMVNERPQNLRYRVAQAWAQVGAKDYESAAKSLGLILRAVPNNPQAQYLRSVTHYHMREFAEAKTFAARVLSTLSDYAPALLVAGAASYELGEYEQARSQLARLVSVAPRFEQGRKLLALTQMRLGQQQAAAETLRPLMVDASEIEDEQTLRLVAAAALQSGDMHSGKNYIEKAVERSPNDAGLRAQLGMTRINLGETEQGMADLEQALQQDDDLVSAELRLALNLMEQTRYEEALEKAVSIQQKIPDKGLGYVLEGNIRGRMGNEDGARQAYHRALEVDPGAFDAAHNLARLEVGHNRLENGRKIYRDFLETNPHNVRILMQLALLDARLSDEAALQDTLDAMIVAAPNAAEPRIFAGRLYLAQNQAQKALSIVEEVLQSHSGNPAILEILGRSQFELDRFDAAVGSFSRWTQAEPSNPISFYWLANAYNRSGKYPEAKTAINQALSLDSTPLATQLLKGQIAVNQGDKAALQDVVNTLENREGVGDVAEFKDISAMLLLLNGQAGPAVQLMEQALTQEPSSERAVRLALALANSQGLAPAVDRLDQWLGDHPDDRSAKVVKGKLFLAAEQYERAEGVFDQLVRERPDDWSAQNDLAWSSYKTGDMSKALKHAEAALRLVPDHPSVLDTHGRVLLASNNPGKAVVSLERAAQGLSDASGTRYELAKAYAQLGEGAQAVSQLEKLLQQGSQFPERAEAEALLAKLTAEE